MGGFPPAAIVIKDFFFFLQKAKQSKVVIGLKYLFLDIAERQNFYSNESQWLHHSGKEE